MTTITLFFCDTAYKYSTRGLRKSGEDIIKALVDLFTSNGSHPFSSFTSRDATWSPYTLHEEAKAPNLFVQIDVRDYSEMPHWVSKSDLNDFRAKVITSLKSAFGGNIDDRFDIEFRFTPCVVC
jgi:hypothetical protein